MKKNKQIVWNKKVAPITALPRLQGNSHHKTRKVWTVAALRLEDVR